MNKQQIPKINLEKKNKKQKTINYTKTKNYELIQSTLKKVK